MAPSNEKTFGNSPGKNIRQKREIYIQVKHFSDNSRIAWMKQNGASYSHTSLAFYSVHFIMWCLSCRKSCYAFFVSHMVFQNQYTWTISKENHCWHTLWACFGLCHLCCNRLKFCIYISSLVPVGGRKLL